MSKSRLWFDHMKFGEAFGIRYRFENEGDFIPAHTHERETAHIVIVLKGAIQLLIDVDGSCQDYRHEAGSIVDFDWRRTHTIAACDDGTEILNLFRHGQPAGWDALPDSEKHGVIELD